MIRLTTAIRDTACGLRSAAGANAVTVVILTFTISTAIVTYTVVDCVAIRPLPYWAPDRLVSLAVPGPAASQTYPPSLQDYFAWADGTQTFVSLGAARFLSPRLWRTSNGAKRLSARSVTSNLFDVLGVKPEIGRLFTVEDERTRAAVVVLAHNTWNQTFNGDPNVIGLQLNLEDESWEIVGVLPENISFPLSADTPDLYLLYIPVTAERDGGAPRRGAMSVVGRLRPGVSIDQARADANRISPVILMPLADQVVGSAKRWMMLVLIAVGLLLLITCVNIGTLFHARTIKRAAEFATRQALGASPRHIKTTVMLEGVVLAVSAMLAAMVVSYWGVEIVRSRLPTNLARVSSIAIDLRIFAACCAASVAVAFAIAGLPAALTGRKDVAAILKSDKSVIGCRSRRRQLTTLLVANIAFVSALLVPSVLVVISFIIVTTADLGFSRHNILTVSYERSLSHVPKNQRAAAATALRSALLGRLAMVPGVDKVAIALNGSPPLSGSSVRYGIEITGVGEVRGIETNMVTADYVDVMGMQLIRGRTISENDRAGTPAVILIDEIAARQLFQDGEPLGQIVGFRGPRKIVGVLRAVHFDGPEFVARPAMYIPADQEPAEGERTFGTIVIRTIVDPTRVASSISEAIRPVLGTEPNQPQFVHEYFRRLTAARRFNALLMGTFGIIALTIGILGVCSTMAFLVVQETRAIGLRIALGASPAVVARSVLIDALRLVLIGIAIGLLGAWWASDLLASFVVGIGPTEPGIYLAVASILTVVTVLAALLPAIRAARVDPLCALRCD